MTKVLYVEDHSPQRDIMKDMLEMLGYEVDLASNGEEGIEKAHEWQPDVILMDLRMPGMGGIEAIKSLKADPTVAEIPIIVVSAWTTRKNRQKALEAGATKFMAKPIDVERLKGQIDEIVAV